MKMLLFVLLAIGYSTCKPTDTGAKQRNKRQYYNFGESDSYLMQELWDQPVGLGFFVNPKGGDSDESDTRQLRDKITSTMLEGSGSIETKRDNIQKRPDPQSETVFAADRLVNSNAETTEITGELKSKIENSRVNSKNKTEETNKGSNDETDPGDKKKLRSSVTCEGQKEWIQCDGPYELIKIKEAFWGRDDEKTCTKSDIIHGLNTKKKCLQDTENTMQKVKESCDNENVCEVVASNIYFDKTDCPDVYKFLRLKWQCAPSESRIKEMSS